MKRKKKLFAAIMMLCLAIAQPMASYAFPSGMRCEGKALPNQEKAMEEGFRSVPEEIVKQWIRDGGYLSLTKNNLLNRTDIAGTFTFAGMDRGKI